MSRDPNARLWSLGLIGALAALIWSFASDFTAPWTEQLDFNGACWSQSAHNTLRVGLVATAGAPSAFYFGTPPIPPQEFYTHHPPLLSLMLTGLFAIFGEAEWVARLLPVASSLVGVILLWLLVKDCTNARTAAFTVLALAAMPMELRYGRMVNFEPVNLVWMLAVLLCLRRRQKSHEGGQAAMGERFWWWLMIGASVLCLWTAWLGYFFVVVVALSTGGVVRRKVRLRSILFVAMVVSLLLFALQIRLVRPDAWHDVFSATNRRMAHGGEAIPWWDWARRMAALLMAHIPPLLWLFGMAGVVIMGKSKRDSSLRWLGWCAWCFFAMSVLYVVLFRNASFIHDYASFYFTVPVAMMAGLALDGICGFFEGRGTAHGVVSVVGVFVILACLAVNGQHQTLALRRPFRILSIDKPEPANLVPDLGKAIASWFGDDVAVICNFLPSYGPQLHYYSRHELLTSVFGARAWAETIADPENAPVGGVVWLGDEEAGQIIATLPPGPQERRSIDGIEFCFWRLAETPHSTPGTNDR